MSDCPRVCIPFEEFDPTIHKLIGIHATEAECLLACECASSSTSGQSNSGGQSSSSDASALGVCCATGIDFVTGQQVTECLGVMTEQECLYEPDGTLKQPIDTALSWLPTTDCNECQNSSASGQSSSSSSSAGFNSAAAEQEWMDYQESQPTAGYTAGYISRCGSPPGPTPVGFDTIVSNTLANGYLKLGGGNPNDNDRFTSINYSYDTVCGEPLKIFIRMQGGGVPARGFTYSGGNFSGAAAYFHNVTAKYYTRPVGSTGQYTETTTSLPFVSSNSTVYFNQDFQPVELGAVELVVTDMAPGNTTGKLFLGLEWLRPAF